MKTSCYPGTLQWLLLRSTSPSSPPEPGISCSASSISLLPKAARLMSATLYVFAGSPFILTVYVLDMGGFRVLKSSIDM